MSLAVVDNGAVLVVSRRQIAMSIAPMRLNHEVERAWGRNRIIAETVAIVAETRAAEQYGLAASMLRTLRRWAGMEDPANREPRSVIVELVEQPAPGRMIEGESFLFARRRVGDLWRPVRLALRRPR
ncbi:MAG: hypothetical protein ACKVT1_05530 [Dehalococcoidia bacterium]